MFGRKTERREPKAHGRLQLIQVWGGLVLLFMVHCINKIL